MIVHRRAAELAPRTLAAAIGLLVAPAFAHVISMSSGDVLIRGTRAHYELRLPLYEMTHVQRPDQSLFEHIRFSSGGRRAQLLHKSCREDPAHDSFVCEADTGTGFHAARRLPRRENTKAKAAISGVSAQTAPVST